MTQQTRPFVHLRRDMAEQLQVLQLQALWQMATKRWLQGGGGSTGSAGGKRRQLFYIIPKALKARLELKEERAKRDAEAAWRQQAAGDV
jgi:hypothetical protein